MASTPDPIAPADLAVLEKLAARVVELRLEVPAILTLETGKPLSLLASQAMIFFEPLAQVLFPGEEYRRYAALAGRREAIEALVSLIERHAEDRRAARATARAGQRGRR